MTTKNIVDWYWNHGVARQGNFTLSRADWLDKAYDIAERQEQLDCIGGAEAPRPTLAVWGPSQSGKSTLLSRYLDLGKSDQGSPCLTWDESSPTVFMDGVGSQVVLNPYHHGSDATGCVTRYSSASQVKHAKYPISLRMNSLGDVMHALACGYLSECAVVTVDGHDLEWSAESFQENFLKSPLEEEAIVSQQAFELMRDVLRIVELFVATRHPRYQKLSKDWSRLRAKLLNESQALRDPDMVVKMAKKLFWDDVTPLSWIFDRIRAKSDSLNWPAGKVYCTPQVASLVIDIASYGFYHKYPKGENPVADSIRRLAFRRVGGDVLIKVADLSEESSEEICNDAFGLFQAMVREVDIPVRIPASTDDAKSAFFRLLSKADLLDFPGVSNRHGNATAGAAINPRTTPPSDPRWLTTVFKRGKTESMVHGYARDVSIDAFALMVRADPHPSSPRQLTTGIEHWWECADPGFRAGKGLSGDRAPLPLSICLTAFAKVINKGDINESRASMDGIFVEMPKQLMPLSAPGYSRFFATTYKHFTKDTDYHFAKDSEVARAAEGIRSQASFRNVFRDEVSRQSFDEMIGKEDGGVEFFLEQQIAEISASGRGKLLLARANEDRKTLRMLVGPALPTGDDDGAAQARVIRKVHDHFSQLVGNAVDLVECEKFKELENYETLLGYWIRLLSWVREEELQPVPESFSQQKPELREKFVKEQWGIWRDKAIIRIREELRSEWSKFGLESEDEFRKFLDAISEHVGKTQLLNWINEELDDITSKVVRRSARRELAVAMGNIIRRGAHHLPDEAPADPLSKLRSLRQGDDAVGGAAQPRTNQIITGFLTMLSNFKPTSGKRPAQPGDRELVELYATL